jgi:hypothetical protein
MHRGPLGRWGNNEERSGGLPSRYGPTNVNRAQNFVHAHGYMPNPHRYDAPLGVANLTRTGGIAPIVKELGYQGVLPLSKQPLIDKPFPYDK